MCANSLTKTVTRQCRDCDLNPGPSAPESSTLTTRLPSHPNISGDAIISFDHFVTISDAFCQNLGLSIWLSRALSSSFSSVFAR